jgi:class 3 adenylate cyclase/tetratricopeptide (TPR) repeat protein
MMVPLDAVGGGAMAELAAGPLTILFSDVEGSTDLRTERGDAAAHRILRSHEDVVRRCVADHGGKEIKALGDGFMVAFVSIRKALECAVAIQQQLEERNVESPGEEVRVRIGVNFGEVTVEGDDLYGQAVNATARIAAKARGGEILVSDVVRQLAGSGPEFTFADRGRLRLKGFPERWHLHSVVYDAGGTPGAVLGGRTPFVGREAERTELRRFVEQVRLGHGALVMIGGEPGVGKTRLAEELTVRCGREGFLIFTGHCYEAAGAAPYIPIVEAFEQALARAPSPKEFRQFLGDEAPEIAKLVPKLRQVCPDIPPPLELPAEQERRYLFNAVWDVLARTAAGQPTLLVLDDIHWADEPTMLLIQHCAERLSDVPVLMVGLYRDSELDAGRPLSRTFGELIRRRLAVHLPLRRLPEETVAQLLTGLAGQPVPPRLVEVIYAGTDGNPFFTEEVFKHLAEEGRLFDAGHQFRTDVSASELAVPDTVRLVVKSRLGRLSDDATKVLGAAAVLGRVFSFEPLQQVEEISEDDLLDLLEAAERSGLISAVDDTDGDDRFLFAHELIRQTVLAELSGARRRRLHGRAADALERIHAAGLEPQAAAIAHHLLEAVQAADTKRALRYLLLAGKWALSTAAFEEALVHLERAAERIAAAAPADRADLLFHLGVARRSTGQWNEAIVTWQDAIAACEASGDTEQAGWICNEAAYSLGWAGRWAESVAMAQRGLDLLRNRTSAVGAGLLAQQGAFLGFGEAPYDMADGLLGEALAIADSLGDPALRGRCLAGLAMNRFAWMRLAECADAGLEAADRLGQAGEVWPASAVSGFVALALLGTGRFAEARAVAEELEFTAERVGNVTALLHSRRVGRGLLPFAQTGDLTGFDAFARTDLRFAADHGLPWVTHSYSWLGLAAFLRGEWTEAQTHFEESAAGEPPGNINGWATACLFEYRAYAGQRDAALALLDGDASCMPLPGQANGSGRWTMLLSAVEGLTVLGETERAGALYDLVAECLAWTNAACPTHTDCRLVERAAGIAAGAAGRFDVAQRHFETALRQAATLPHRPEEAHTRRWYARMLLDRDGPGDGQRADELARAAVADYERMGMPRHRELAAALLTMRRA